MLRRYLFLEVTLCEYHQCNIVPSDLTKRLKTLFCLNAFNCGTMFALWVACEEYIEIKERNNEKPDAFCKALRFCIRYTPLDLTDQKLQWPGPASVK